MKQDIFYPEITIPVGHQVRVSTLNALHSNNAVAERTSLMCDELQVLQPDIICLQEVIFEPDGSSIQLKNLTHESGLNIITAMRQTPADYKHSSGTAILSRLHPIEAGSFPLGTPTATNDNASYAVLEHSSGRTVIAITAHLHWGGDKGRERLVQLTAIDRRAKQLMSRYETMNPMVVLTGDFNTLPDSDSIRFMKGLAPGSDGGYTFWSDTWDTLGTPENEVTLANDNHWAKNTAQSVGILLPHLMPNRRIDYVMGLDWTYGKAGSPLTFQRSFDSTERFGFPASDHHGITVDFWAPPVAA